MSIFSFDSDCESCRSVVADRYENRCPLCAKNGRHGRSFVVQHSRGGLALPNANHAEFKCMDRACGHFLWLPQPENAKRTRRKSHRELVERYGSGFCQMCRIEESSLMPPGSQLVAHHVIEVDAENGGDERENIWILCPSCHSLIHHERTYRGFYRKRGAA